MPCATSSLLEVVDLAVGAHPVGLGRRSPRRARRARGRTRSDRRCVKRAAPRQVTPEAPQVRLRALFSRSARRSGRRRSCARRARCVTRRIAPPLPAASLPSNTATTDVLLEARIAREQVAGGPATSRAPCRTRLRPSADRARARASTLKRSTGVPAAADSGRADSRRRLLVEALAHRGEQSAADGQRAVARVGAGDDDPRRLAGRGAAQERLANLDEAVVELEVLPLLLRRLLDTGRKRIRFVQAGDDNGHFRSSRSGETAGIRTGARSGRLAKTVKIEGRDGESGRPLTVHNGNVHRTWSDTSTGPARPTTRRSLSRLGARHVSGESPGATASDRQSACPAAPAASCCGGVPEPWPTHPPLRARGVRRAYSSRGLYLYASAAAVNAGDA